MNRNKDLKDLKTQFGTLKNGLIEMESVQDDIDIIINGMQFDDDDLIGRELSKIMDVLANLEKELDDLKTVNNELTVSKGEVKNELDELIKKYAKLWGGMVNLIFPKASATEEEKETENLLEPFVTLEKVVVPMTHTENPVEKKSKRPPC